MATPITTTCFAMLALAVLPLTSPARAQTVTDDYTLVIASGFLCDPGDSSTCPAASKSVQGDRLELSGAGTFDAQSKSASAAGTFTRKSANGFVLETGVWTAKELIRFHSYGIAPDAFRRERRAPGMPPFGPGNRKAVSGPVPSGGLAEFRIVIQSISGTTRSAILEVNSALGDVPRERSVEGIRVNFEGGANDYTEEAGGRVMFMRVRPAAGTISHPPPQKNVIDTPENPGR